MRSIGISNYYAPEEYERIAGDAEIAPSVVQNENHPYYQNTELQACLADKIVIPGSSKPEHIRENIEALDFTLTDEEMKAIASLDKGRRFENW